MQQDDRDAAYLLDMLEAARTVQELVAGVTWRQYQADRKLQLAVERAVEIIGEAAHNVSAAFQQAHAEIPWRLIVGQRNVLAHEYGRIDQELLWKVAVNRVPSLIASLQPLIPPPPG